MLQVSKEINHTIYKETLVELRARIEAQYGSVQKFCHECKVDRANLYKIFNATKTRKTNAGNKAKEKLKAELKPQEMSIGLFTKICVHLGNPVAVNSFAALSNSNLSLKQYLEIDNNAVFKCIMFINFSDMKQQKILDSQSQNKLP